MDLINRSRQKSLIFDKGKAASSAASLTSLSPLRLIYLKKNYPKSLFYVSSPDSLHARLEVNYNYWNIIKDWNLEAAVLTANDYIASGNTNYSSSWTRTGEVTIDGYNTYFTLFGALADSVLSTTQGLSEAGSATARVASSTSSKIGIISLMLAGAQLGHDIYHYGAEDEDTAINLYKNLATNAGVLYSFMAGYTSAALSLGFLGVALTGYGLDLLIETAKEVQDEALEKIFDAYYQEQGASFNEEAWYKLFVDSYYSARQDSAEPEKSMELAIKRVKKGLDDHAEHFWTSIFKDGSEELSFAVADAKVRNYFEPREGLKEELTASYKHDLYWRFNERLIPWINDFMLHQLQDEVYAGLLDLARPFNHYYRVQVQEVMPFDSAEACRYQNHAIYFGHEEGFYQGIDQDQWSLYSPEDDDEWAVALDFTLLSYIYGAMPDHLYLYKEGRNGGNPEKADLKLPFALKAPRRLM